MKADCFSSRCLGRTLEETAALFDGDEQPQDLIAMGGEAATMTMTMSRGGALQERRSLVNISEEIEDSPNSSTRKSLDTDHFQEFHEMQPRPSRSSSAADYYATAL